MKTSAPLLAIAAVLALSACASSDKNRVSDAVTAPLSDFNLVQAKIPEVLLKIEGQPYAVPGDQSCAALLADVQALDAVLGADFDTPETAERPSLLARGTTEAGNAAVNALRSTTEGVVPFRGWVRKLTGAERYSRKVASAIAAGGVRRAFLKGIRLSQGCPAVVAAKP